MNDQSHAHGEGNQKRHSLTLPREQRQLWERYFSGSKNLFGECPSAFAEECLKALSTGVGRILDLGGGEGRDSILFAKHGYAVVCLDFCLNAIGSAREESQRAQQRIQFEVADMSTGSLPFAERAFDCVFSHASLHYFDEATTSRLFADVRRVLVPGGLFAFTVKSTNDPLYGQGIEIERNMFVLNGHGRHFFDLEYAREKVSGFEVLRMTEVKRELCERMSTFIECMCRKPSQPVAIQ